MNKLKKLGLLSLCTFSILSVGVGALTHSNNHDRVKVSATNEQQETYLYNYIYKKNVNYGGDTESYVDDHLLYRYSDGYKLRYLNLLSDTGNIIDFYFPDDNGEYLPFNLTELIYDEINDAYNINAQSINGDSDFYFILPNDYPLEISISYANNVPYDNFYDVNNTISLLSLENVDGIYLQLPNYYHYDFNFSYNPNVKYMIPGYDDVYTSMRFNNDVIVIGDNRYTNKKLLDNGHICFLLYDFDFRDFRNVNNTPPPRINIFFILQETYDFLIKPKQDKIFYLSKWFLDLYTASAPVVTNNTNWLYVYKYLKVNNTYYDIINIKFEIRDFSTNSLMEHDKLFQLSNGSYDFTIFENSYNRWNGENTNVIQHWINPSVEIIDSYDEYQQLLGMFLLPIKSSVSDIGYASTSNTFIPNADLGGTMTLFGNAFNGVAGFLSIEILPNISLWILLMLPFFVTLLIFIVKLFKR